MRLRRRSKQTRVTPGRSMETRQSALWLRFVVVALIAALGSGVGLPGWVAALSLEDNHVCTCASGGGHSSCPVCNPPLGEGHGRSRYVEVRGTPCGEKRVAFSGASEPGVLPAACGALLFGFDRAGPVRDAISTPRMQWVEPPTPPPRIRRA
jgi:hypothetical protein